MTRQFKNFDCVIVLDGITEHQKANNIGKIGYIYYYDQKSGFMNPTEEGKCNVVFDYEYEGEPMNGFYETMVQKIGDFEAFAHLTLSIRLNNVRPTLEQIIKAQEEQYWRGVECMRLEKVARVLWAGTLGPRVELKILRDVIACKYGLDKFYTDKWPDWNKGETLFPY